MFSNILLYPGGVYLTLLLTVNRNSSVLEGQPLFLTACSLRAGDHWDVGFNFFLGDVEIIYLSFELVEAVSVIMKTEKKSLVYTFPF